MAGCLKRQRTKMLSKQSNVMALKNKSAKAKNTAIWPVTTNQVKSAWTLTLNTLIGFKPLIKWSNFLSELWINLALKI